jgi:hypothetical protein
VPILDVPKSDVPLLDVPTYDVPLLDVPVLAFRLSMFLFPNSFSG